MALHPGSKDVTTTLDELSLKSDRRLAGLGFAIMLLPALAFVGTDFSHYEPGTVLFWARLGTRAALVVVAIVGLLSMRAATSRASYGRSVVTVAFALIACLFTLSLLRPAGSGLPLRSPLLAIPLLYFVVPNTFWRKITPPLVLSAGLVVLRLTRLGDADVADAVADVVALVVLNALGVATAWRIDRLDQAMHAVVGELHMLRGIIPICSYCKKVRSEVGDWQGIERYVDDRSDAAFSHGIRPDCLPAAYAQAGLEMK